ncbi:MAG: hypothetical protein GC149_12505 [Gammaproteobacteria bacterium]|nr:hypothetical protein [Gammaproteobacteria bacterium]
MSFSISDSNGYHLAEVSNISVSGLPGMGSYTLCLNLDFSIHPPKSDIYIQDLTIRLDGGDNHQRMIGISLPETGQKIKIASGINRLHLSFRMPIMPSQMEAIESYRNGGDLKLKIWMTGEVIQGDKSSHLQQTSDFTIPQQQWVEALFRMEYRETMLYEMKLPIDNPSLVKDIVRKAQQHMLNGYYDECVAECRKLLEANDLNDIDKTILKEARNKYKGDSENRQSMTINERFMVLREILAHTTHLAHHHNPGDGYSRKQAQVILGMIVAMVGGLSG